MKSLLFIVLTLISSCFISFSQFIGQQPAVNKEFEEDITTRDEYLYQIRMFPVESNAPDAMTKALLKRNLNRERYNSQNDFTPWVSLGPTPGPNFDGVGSRTTVVRFNPTNPLEIYIAASDGGVWKSTDGGATFVPKTDNQPSLSSGAMEVYQGFAINPTIFYGTGEGGFGHVYEYYGQGLLISYDGGDNWTQVLNGLPYNSYFYKIAINPANSNMILAGLGTGYANTVYSGGLYRSMDFGLSWTRIIPASLGENGLTCSDVVFSPDGSKAYIIGPDDHLTPRPWENGVGYRMSTDGGMTFFGFRQNPIPNALQLAISNSSPNILFAYAVTSECGVKLYKSTNSGFNWFEVGNPGDGCCSQFGYNMVLKVDPNHPDTVYMGGRYLYKSVDGGNTWPYFISAPHMDHHDLDIDPSNTNHLIVGCDGGVFQSFDGGTTWQNLNHTITTLGLYSIASDPTQYYHMIAGAQDNSIQYRPNTNQPPNQTWYTTGGGDGTSVYIDKNDPSKALAQMSATSIGLSYSNNGGSSWNYCNGLYPDYGYPWIPAITDDPSNPGRYYTGRYEVFRSDDYGENWYPTSDQGNMHGYDKVHNIAISPISSDRLFASVGTFEYYPPDNYYQGIFKSLDGGVSWTNLNLVENGLLPQRFISAIGFDPNDKGLIVTLCGFGTNHVYKTKDEGVTWTILDPNFAQPSLPDVPVNDFVVYTNPFSWQSIYIVATDIGVFYSDGTSGQWFELYDGLPNNVVMDIEQYGTMLRVATLGRGAWEMNFASIDDQFKNTKAYNYSLKDNYPNPFNPSTNISFSLAKDESVKIIVYDITGREIILLLNEFKNKGEYTVKFDGTNLASGVYFYKIITDNFTETKKMLLVK